MQMPTFYSLQKVLAPLGAIGLLALAYRHYGWPGVAAAGGALVMWMLLHFTRMLQVMQRAAHRPKGYVDSAVMLNAKLRAGMTLLHVVAMTRALGQPLGEPDAPTEMYGWTDGSLSSVRCEFRGGRLKNWSLQRPNDGVADGAP
ncbi:MAG: glycerate kinase [Rhodoferax sp.]|nr:glycerate kinase [Rhodoferax sp.]